MSNKEETVLLSFHKSEIAKLMKKYTDLQVEMVVMQDKHIEFLQSTLSKISTIEQIKETQKQRSN
jgi:acetolactate synthase regulatory subunit